ncbi:hypothetical protein [Rhizobium leguminosarum]|uniref:hypothetical protein n=1 Tax=Rhizobium leguminosarum TaxID=384 RepID=UPI002E0D80E6|nr:hypothetical protein U8Q02_40830 [Rhizobium leguminosarum]
MNLITDETRATAVEEREPLKGTTTMGKTKAIRTRCRCGLKYKSGGCPKFWMEGELTAYHDHVAQDIPEEMRNWIVIGRNGKFIPCAGGREGPTHFDLEREAWEELDKLYNDQMEWPEDEMTIYSYESVRLQAEAAKEAGRSGRAA